MKKGQTATIIFLLLVIVVLFVAIVVSYSNRPSVTGKAVYQESCREVQTPRLVEEISNQTEAYIEEECEMKDAFNYNIYIKEENVHLANGNIGVSIHLKHNYQKIYFYVDYEIYCEGDYSSEATFKDRFASVWQEGNYDGSYFIGEKFDKAITYLKDCQLKVIEARYRDCREVMKLREVPKTKMVTIYQTETICD